jgi:NADH-quinone oxidoreductase subunit I
MYPVVAPTIKIDQQRCLTPFACKRCIQVCPTAVFGVYETKMVRMEETDKYEPGTFRLRVIYRDKCSGCNQCVDVCPEHALSVTMLSGVPA